MVVCKFFQQGNCRFGDNCKYEHPREQRNNTFASQNRFGVFQSPPSSGGGGSIARRDNPYSINIADIRNDVTDGKGRPKWLLSSYGPGRNPPASLFEGNEYSFEEVRLRFYELRANGKIDEANQEASSLWSKAEQAMNDALNNAGDAVKFIEDAERKHPNRLDLTKVDGTKTRDQIIKEAESGNSLGGSADFGQSNPFAKPTTAFGQPASSSSFGSGGFGQPAQPSSFGQPSGTFAQPAASAFGKPTIGFGQPSFGRPAQPVFGQPAQPAPAFGQPAKPTSVFGQPAPPAPVFGQSSQPVFGQAAQPSSAFGKPAFGSSGFGQPSPLGAKNAFAAPSAATGFGQPSFGQSTPAFGQPAQPSSGFGQSSRPSTGFGQPAQSNLFGQPSQTTQPNPFGKPTQPSPFSQPTTTSSGFGQPAISTASESTSTSAFGQTSTATPSFGQPPSQPSNPFGARVENKPDDDVGNATTSMFSPDGPPTTNSNPFGVSNQTSGLDIGTTQATRKSSLSEVAILPPNTNSSAAPHPLTNKAPRPLHYTQTIPATAPTVTDPATGKLQRYRGRPVQYLNDNPCYERPDGRGWERIWFPQNGKTPEVVYLGREDKIGDLVADNERYTDEIIHGFAYLFEMGKFKDGEMPAVPPKREWCLYDF